MTIRRAEPGDTDVMVSLLAELFEIEDDFAADPAKQRAGLVLLLNDPLSVILVVELRGNVVAMGTMQRLVSTASGEYVGLVEDVVVTGSQRGKGIGKLLLESLIALARQRGYARIALGADGRNGRAISFYKRFGFRTSHMGLMYRP